MRQRHPRIGPPALAGTLFLAMWSGTVTAQVLPAPNGVQGAPLAAQNSDDDDDGDFIHTINQYYSIILDDDLEPEVQDKLIPLWVTSVFCGAFCGALWIPMLWVGEDPGVDYFAKEALFLILKEWLTNLVGGATSSFGVGAIILAASTFYLTPIGIINAYDRALKTNRRRSENADGRRDDDKKKKKRKKKHKAAGHDDRGAAPKHKLFVMAY